MLEEHVTNAHEIRNQNGGEYSDHYNDHDLA
jgi:hypothetical protein